ncbi:MAG: mechanosensitive ion channel domain-containing protein, partial [Beijerinckiaceae bacterium]
MRMRKPHPPGTSSEARRVMWRIGLAALAAAAMAAGLPARSQTPVRSEAPIVLELKGGEKSDDINRMLETLRRDGKTVVVRFADSPAAAPTPASVAPPSAALAAAPPGDADMAMTLDRGMRAGLRSIPTILKLGPDLSRAWGERSWIGVWSLIIAALALSVGGGWLAHRAVAKWIALYESHCTARTTSRLALSLRRLVADVSALVVAAALMRALTMWWIAPGQMADASVAAAWQSLIIAGLYLIVGRFFLSPGQPEARLLALPHADWHFRVLLIYIGFGQIAFIMLSLGEAAATDHMSVAGMVLLVATIFGLVKILWFWAGRKDFENLVLAGARDRANPGPLRRAAAASVGWMLIASALAIWVIGRMAAVLPDGAYWAWAAGLTQFLVVLVPILAIGAAHLVRDLHQHEPDEAPPTPLRKAFGVTLELAVAGAVWFAGFFALVRLWGDFFMQSGSSMLVKLVRDLLIVEAVLIFGFLLFVFLKTFFDAHAPKSTSLVPGEDDGGAHVQSRIGSVLPVLRGVALGAVAGLTILVALSKLGVDIGPLLAAFGILGLALSFGSQALVRDIVSGLFFMLEDAFRVGEYIDTGRLRGTVESISLRSVRLRHQSGQVHTVPFGQIASITN